MAKVLVAPQHRNSEGRNRMAGYEVLPSTVARHSFHCAAAETAKLFSLPNGPDEDKREARNQLVRMASDPPIQYGCTSPSGGRDVIEALPPDEEYPSSNTYTLSGAAISAVLMSADLRRTSGFLRRLWSAIRIIPRNRFRAAGWDLRRVALWRSSRGLLKWVQPEGLFDQKD